MKPWQPCSEIWKTKLDMQLAPPHMHRRNATKRAIQTFKDHFIAGLVSTDPQFPPQLWCRLLPRATLTLNLLIPLHINPRLSAEAQFNGAFDFNQNTVSTTRHKSVSTQKTQSEKDLGAIWG
eukprot:1414291-Ditylum_brightwellii.AAC.1